MFLRSKSQITMFEDDPVAAAAAAAATAKAASDAAAAKADAAAAAANDDTKFTQEQVNTFVAEERRKSQQQQRKLAVELEQLKKSSSLTNDEKDGLEKRIDDLQTQYMTAEEKARRAEEKAEKKNTEQIETLTKERDIWKAQHSQLVISTAIVKSAAEQKALFHEQITALLGPKTKLTERLDDEGKPTGDYEPKVSFEDTDKDSKPIILELTVPEAVKRMKELEQYGNLFDGGKTGGLGGTGSQTSGAKIDLAKIAKEDPAQYRKLRKDKPELFR